jgi:hypothetical protein
MTGAGFPLTPTTKLQLAVLFAPSMAEHTTVVAPTGNNELLAGVHDEFLIPDPSVAENEKITGVVVPVPLG